MTTKSSYIDYATILSPQFSPIAYANSLILATNNASDTSLDLATPLSRVLFDVQEIDTYIDTLTTTHADVLVGDTQEHVKASTRVLTELETQVNALEESYGRLEREVVEKFETAERVRLAAERLVQTLRLGRKVQRALQIGRQLETQMEEVGGKDRSLRVMVQAAGTIVTLKTLLNSDQSKVANELDRVRVLTSLRNDVLASAERTLLAKAQQVIKEFSMSSLVNPSAILHTSNLRPAQQQQSSVPTFAQTEEVKTRATSALQTLYLLSPVNTPGKTTLDTFEPTLLIAALSGYIQNALTSSLAALARALATLPTLDRTLVEISARCQNLVALEATLASTKTPSHPLVLASPSSDPSRNVSISSEPDEANLLNLLLQHLDTSSLPSYFWRSMAGQSSSRVQEILNRGGVSARTLRANRDRVRDLVRECVDRGSRLPSSVISTRRSQRVENWEREAAVMVSSVVGPLQR